MKFEMTYNCWNVEISRNQQPLQLEPPLIMDQIFHPTVSIESKYFLDLAFCMP